MSHYGSFSHAAASRPDRRAASRSDHHDLAHRSLLKMVPIWVFWKEREWELAGGTNEAPRIGLFTASALLRLGLICSLQERRGMDGPHGSWLRSVQAAATRRWEVRRLVR